MVDTTWLSRIRWKNKVAKPGAAYLPTTLEHLANVLTHLMAVPYVMFRSYRLVTGVRDMMTEDVAAASAAQKFYWPCLIYALVSVGLFSVSSTFHLLAFGRCSRMCTNVFHRLDRAMIYLFIAGSYTPWLYLKDWPAGSPSSWLQTGVWPLALVGLVYQQLFHECHKLLSTIFYVVIAALPGFAIVQMEDPAGLDDLKLGGIIYVVGVVFFKLDGRVAFAHAIWHLHVVVASLVLFNAVQNHLIPID